MRRLGSGKTVHTTVCIKEETKERLFARAHSMGIKPSELVRALIEAAAENTIVIDEEEAELHLTSVNYRRNKALRRRVVRRLKAAGLSQRKIARHLGVHDGTISRDVKLMSSVIEDEAVLEQKASAEVHRILAGEKIEGRNPLVTLIVKLSASLQSERGIKKWLMRELNKYTSRSAVSVNARVTLPPQHVIDYWKDQGYSPQQISALCRGS